MIPENLLTKFQPDSKVPHSRIKKLMITIRQFGSETKKTDNADNVKNEVSEGLMKAGMEIMEKLSTAKDELITELVTIFFKLSNQESEDLDFEVREEMFAKISDARPDLIAFLSLSSPSNKMKMENLDHPTE